MIRLVPICDSVFSEKVSKEKACFRKEDSEVGWWVEEGIHKLSIKIFRGGGLATQRIPVW